MPLLGYSRWENFDLVIAKAMIACEMAKVTVSDQFREVTKLIEHGKGGKRRIKDFSTGRQTPE